MFKKKSRPAATKSEQEPVGPGDDQTGADEKTIIVDPETKRRKKDFVGTSTSASSGTKALDEAARKEAWKKELFTAGTYDGIETFGVDRRNDGKEAATRTINVDADHTQDARAILERNQAICKEIDAGNIDTSIYRGEGAKKSFLHRSDAAIQRSKVMGNMGPVRANNTIRSTFRFEYWGTSGDGGVCKEYQQTGFCGRGDSCLYMHDRSIYKKGWQLDIDWNAKMARKEQRLKRKMELTRKMDETDRNGYKAGLTEEEEKELEDIEEWQAYGSSDEEGAAKRKKEDEELMPTSCFKCKESWAKRLEKNIPPVVTSCGHYVCEACAMENFKKSKKCMQCGKITDGIFNNVEDEWNKQLRTKELRKIERQQEREKQVKSQTSGVTSNIPYQERETRGKD